MDASTWTVIVSALSDADVNVCVEAAERLHAEVSAEDIPGLLSLLKSNDFFIREAAAWPLAELAGPAVLADLFEAYQRGLNEGHDGDSFATALIEIPSLHAKEARLKLEQLAVSEDHNERTHASWLLEFCEGGRAA